MTYKGYGFVGEREQNKTMSKQQTPPFFWLSALEFFNRWGEQRGKNPVAEVCLRCVLRVWKSGLASYQRKQHHGVASDVFRGRTQASALVEFVPSSTQNGRWASCACNISKRVMILRDSSDDVKTKT